MRSALVLVSLAIGVLGACDKARGDTDGDGISDRRDQCPCAPEDHNGLDDDDGCPENLPAAMVSALGGTPVPEEREPTEAGTLCIVRFGDDGAIAMPARSLSDVPRYDKLSMEPGSTVPDDVVIALYYPRSTYQHAELVLYAPEGGRVSIPSGAAFRGTIREEQPGVLVHAVDTYLAPGEVRVLDVDTFCGGDLHGQVPRRGRLMRPAGTSLADVSALVRANAHAAPSVLQHAIWILNAPDPAAEVRLHPPSANELQLIANALPERAARIMAGTSAH